MKLLEESPRRRRGARDAPRRCQRRSAGVRDAPPRARRARRSSSRSSGSPMPICPAVKRLAKTARALGDEALSSRSRSRSRSYARRTTTPRSSSSSRSARRARSRALPQIALTDAAPQAGARRRATAARSRASSRRWDRRSPRRSGRRAPRAGSRRRSASTRAAGLARPKRDRRVGGGVRDPRVRPLRGRLGPARRAGGAGRASGARRRCRRERPARADHARPRRPRAPRDGARVHDRAPPRRHDDRCHRRGCVQPRRGEGQRSLVRRPERRGEAALEGDFAQDEARPPRALSGHRLVGQAPTRGRGRSARSRRTTASRRSRRETSASSSSMRSASRSIASPTCAKGDPRVEELVRFVLSPAYLELRRALGLEGGRGVSDAKSDKDKRRGQARSRRGSSTGTRPSRSGRRRRSSPRQRRTARRTEPRIAPGDADSTADRVRKAALTSLPRSRSPGRPRAPRGAGPPSAPPRGRRASAPPAFRTSTPAADEPRASLETTTRGARRAP